MACSVLRRISVLASVFAASACRDDTVSGTAATRSAWYVPAIAAQLDASGRLPGTRPQHADDSEISAERSGALADKFVAQFGSLSEVFWSRDARRPIVASQLRRCGRIDFVEHPYVVLPSEASDNFQALFGAQWLVRYCQQDLVLAVEVYVSAKGLSISLDSLGNFRSNVPLVIFSTRGVTVDHFYDATPEDASANAYRRTPNPIASLPQILSAGRGWAPWIRAFVLIQSNSTSVRDSVAAFPFGYPTQWQLRQADSTAVELDTLVDPGFNPVVLRILQRRRAAPTLAEMKHLPSP